MNRRRYAAAFQNPPNVYVDEEVMEFSDPQARTFLLTFKLALWISPQDMSIFSGVDLLMFTITDVMSYTSVL